jgi:hypothetical protein
MVTDDEYLERIVAGIHAQSADQAEVTWNEKINGRQFDVVLRFTLGGLRFLVLIEVKNRGRRASASDIEAFVTKASDQSANKVVFVTAAGFQSGAIEVAKRHGVDLFTVQFVEDEFEVFNEGSVILKTGDVHIGGAPAEIQIGDPVLMTRVNRAALIYKDSRRFELPSETTQMAYYATRTLLKDGRSIEQVIAGAIPREPALGEKVHVAIPMKRPELIIPPDEYFFPNGKISSVEFEVEGAMMRPMRGNTYIEPTSFRNPVVYKNELTGEETRYSLGRLPLGLKEAEPGKFYFVMHPLRYYFCEKVSGDLVHWTLVESFQGNRLIRSRFTQKLEYSYYFMPVTSRTIMRRLKARLKELEELDANAKPA